MRFRMLTAVLLCAACSKRDTAADNAGAPVTMNATTPEAQEIRGNQPMSSASAQAARATVIRYFTFIKRGDYEAARLIWGNNGADTRGTPKAFADSFKTFSVYNPSVGDPTEIKATGGMQYVAVQAKLHVERRDNGKTADRRGVVMLKRSTDPNDPAVDKREWRIWGVDIRTQH